METRVRTLDVACVSRSAQPRSGGIEAHMQRTAEGLVERGHRMRVFAARIDDRPFTRTNTTIGAQSFGPFVRGGVQTHPVPAGLGRRLRMLPAALGAIPGADRLGYDRVRELTLSSVVAGLAPGFASALGDATHVHGWGGEPLMHAARTAARDRGIPFLITPFAHPGHWGDDPLNARLYRDADLVIALLDGEARFYESLGVAPERIRVIGVAAPEPPQGTPPDVRPPHGIGDGPLVLCLGVKRPYKYRALLDALPHIADPNVRFAFVGPETPDSQRDFAACRDPRVVRVGKVDEVEKWGWLGAATVLCLPSVSEIMPVSVLEAWRTATAVVVAEGRFTRDLVTDGTDGIVCAGEGEAIAKAIGKVLADPAAAEQMGQAGRAGVARRYEPGAIVAAHEEAYESLA